MNIWNRILHRINQKNIPLPLGRWKLESCHQKINQKIDSSNEDHCGTCANGTILEKPIQVKVSIPVKKSNQGLNLDSLSK